MAGEQEKDKKKRTTATEAASKIGAMVKATIIGAIRAREEGRPIA